MADRDPHPEDERPQRDRSGRRPPETTPAFLRDWALRYLDRYSASAAHLRRLMTIKLEASVRQHGTPRAEGQAAIEGVIAELTDKGLLDDAGYALGRTRTLHRRGASAQAIRARLLAKGLGGDAIEGALRALSDEAGDPELAAAIAYARRRRLGPFRAAAERDGRRARDLAALDRQGFAYELALRVIDAADIETLETEAEQSAL